MPRRHVHARVGDDDAPGTTAEPWRTIGHAFRQLGPGDTLIVHGGVYEEADPTFLPVHPGEEGWPVIVKAAGDGVSTVRGLLWLEDPSWWRITGLTVEWWDGGPVTAEQHMVRIRGGRGWTLAKATLRGARSFANLNVTGEAVDWTVRTSAIHDNWGDPSHGTARDQLFYVGADVQRGVIERNLLWGAPRGKAVKLTGPDPGTGCHDVTVRYNTIHDVEKPAVTPGWSTSGCQVYRNLIVGCREPNGAIRGYQLDRDAVGNVAYDNAAFDVRGPLVASDRGFPQAVGDGGGTVLLSGDPMFDRVRDPLGYRPLSTVARLYGRWAPEA